MTEYEKNLDGLKRMRIALATVLVDGERVEPYLTAAIEAMEKQLSKKPIADIWSPAYCPNKDCRTVLSELLGDGYYEHWENLTICPQCGQSLDWSN